MNEQIIVERLFQTLIAGDRVGARQVLTEPEIEALPAEDLTQRVLYPTLDMVNELFGARQLSTIAHHYAIRLLRTLVDQAQARYTQQESRGRRILMFCGAGDADDLAGQLVADLVESRGYEMYFGGGGIANDEILAAVGEYRPDLLLLFTSLREERPRIRELVDQIRGVGACPELQIVVGGGIVKRGRPGARELGADLWACDVTELLEKLDPAATPASTRPARSGRRPTAKGQAA